MKSLYSYFGLLDLHAIDSPGHSLYQLGLIDSIRHTFGEEKFDFYSYYPKEVLDSINVKETEYPQGILGNLFIKYRKSLIESYAISTEDVLAEIRGKKYNKLYLKARFRNLSTLAKKWKDAAIFETMISTAVQSGYSADEIIILDTDLSLPPAFFDQYGDHVTVTVPSINFPGISKQFLDECVEIHTAEDESAGSTFETRSADAVFYGNIDTSSYKSGNEKSSDLPLILEWIQNDYSTRGEGERFVAICKEKDRGNLRVPSFQVARNDRHGIWKTLERSRIMFNITKDKYDLNRFIPARVYEAMIFGMIPVSYKFNWLSPAFSFMNDQDLAEILKYLRECSPSDIAAAYKHFVKDYLKHEEHRKISGPRLS